MAECPRRHFVDEYEALEHIRRHHSGTGETRMCECGAGCVIDDRPQGRKLLTGNLRSVQLDQKRSCFEKVRYSNDKVARIVIRKRRFDGRAYACTVCGGWHITKAKLR